MVYVVLGGSWRRNGCRGGLRGKRLDVGMRFWKPRSATLKQFLIANQWQMKGVHRGELKSGSEGRRRHKGAVGINLPWKEPRG